MFSPREQLSVWKQQWLEEWQPRYHGLEPREQWVLKFAAVVIPLIVLIFGIILPLKHQHTALLKSVTISTQQAQEAEALAQQLQQQTTPASTPQAQGSLLSRVDQLVTAQGVRSFVTQMRPQSAMDGKQRLRLLLKDIPYQKVASLLLASDKVGLQTEQLKVQKTATEGYVQVQLLLALT